jgi:hypothetical protein
LILIFHRLSFFGQPVEIFQCAQALRFAWLKERCAGLLFVRALGEK